MHFPPFFSMSRTGQLQKKQRSLGSCPTLSNWVTKTQQLGPEQKLNAFVYTQERNVTGDPCPGCVRRIWFKERQKCEERTTVREGRQRQRDRQNHTQQRGDREEAVWPEFNNALVCHTWTEFVGQISMEGQRGCKGGRRKRQSCAGQTDRLLFIT